MGPQEAVEFVRAFAKDTGDLGALSKNDVDVLALAYWIERSENGMKNIKNKPVSIDVLVNGLTRPDNFVEVEESQMEEKEPEDSEWTTVKFDKRKGSQKKMSNPIDNLVKLQMEKEVVNIVDDPARKEEDDGLEDDEELGGAWINAENLNQEHALQPSVSNEPVSASSVAVITTDFAMQNVLLQMGLRLISVNGMRLSRIQKTVKKCYGCMRLENDSSKIFCSHCGGHTLGRIFITIDNGKVIYKQAIREVINKRGTIFNVPKMKNKHELPMLLREDQLLVGKYKHMANRRVKKEQDFFDDSGIIQPRSTVHTSFTPVCMFVSNPFLSFRWLWPQKSK